LANFDVASVAPGVWTSYSGVAKITTAGDYLVSFTFNTPDTPANPDPANPGGKYNAKDVVIDRAYVIGDANGGGVPIPSAAVPEPYDLGNDDAWLRRGWRPGLARITTRSRPTGVIAEETRASPIAR
jgi:hypothetical protein